MAFGRVALFFILCAVLLASQAIVGAGVGSLLYGMAAITTRGLAVPIRLHAA